ncbi:Sulfotransferase family protein [Asanoa hainanensis]|uniref:Sulfotransferase family protein n=1 Tax=Asanoa hainanensis TaxID=560556 RepID=A0A239P1I6_9ACTN|nr:sulfotransferase [Asanoa hainanensis]SNT60945.1 Sulfotransferase family protein [Asanoa hainanensis]
MTKAFSGFSDKPLAAAAGEPALDPTRLAELAATRGGVLPATSRFLPGLVRLCEALEKEAALTPSGRVSAQRSLVNALVTQADLHRLQSGRPQVRRQPVGRPLFITGLHRSGTTLLQWLLSRHPQVRAPRLWELLAPSAASAPDELVGAADGYVRDYHRAAPTFAAIHPLSATEPEECHRLLGNAFLSEIYALRFHIPSYMDWLGSQDREPAYQFHLEQLRAILWRVPGEQVVLKCPFHLWHGGALRRVYPHARVVRLHRDPVEAIASACSLTRAVRAARSDAVDPLAIGDFWIDRARSGVARLADLGPTANGGLPTLDLRYRDLIADPIAAVRRVCRFLRLPLSAEIEGRIQAALRSGHLRKQSEHTYRLQDFGLRPARLEAMFADYRVSLDLASRRVLSP